MIPAGRGRRGDGAGARGRVSPEVRRRQHRRDREELRGVCQHLSLLIEWSRKVERPSSSSRQRPAAAQRRRPRRGPANVVLVGLSGTGQIDRGPPARATPRLARRRHRSGDSAPGRHVGPGDLPRSRRAVLSALESETIAEVCRRSRQVIATGGGSFVADANRSHLLNGNMVVYLEPAGDARGTAQSKPGPRAAPAARASGDLVERLAELGRQRDQQYPVRPSRRRDGSADPTGGSRCHRRARPRPHLSRPSPTRGRSRSRPGTSTYEALVGPGASAEIGPAVERAGLKGKPRVIADRNVWSGSAARSRRRWRASGGTSRC